MIDQTSRPHFLLHRFPNAPSLDVTIFPMLRCAYLGPRVGMFVLDRKDDECPTIVDAITRGSLSSNNLPPLFLSLSGDTRQGRSSVRDAGREVALIAHLDYRTGCGGCGGEATSNGGGSYEPVAPSVSTDRATWCGFVRVCVCVSVHP